jgi:hypothetical protein
MNRQNVRREDWILGGVALVLAIALLFFPWFTVSLFGQSASSSATGSPDAWVGVLALLVVLALIADLALERFAPEATIPPIGGSREMTRFALAAAAGAFVLLKWIFHPLHFSGIVTFGWGFYVTVVLAAVLVLFSLQLRRGQALALPGRGGFRPVSAAGAPTTTVVDSSSSSSVPPPGS